MAVRSHVTASPVEVGLAPAVTVAVSVTEEPAVTGLGAEAPLAEGLVGVGGPVDGVSEKSSTARPSSAPLASKSVQRIQKVAPSGMLREPIVDEMAVRSAAALPFLAPMVTVSGVVKLSAATPVQAPVLRAVAFKLYSKRS